MSSSDAASAEKPQVFLESDDEIRGQKYVCLSFLTPNRGVLRNKDIFFFNKFLEFYAMDYKIKATESFVLAQLRDIQSTLSDLEIALANAEVTDASGGAAVLKEQGEKIAAARGKLSQKVSGDLEAHVKANLADFKESSIVESYEKYMLVNRQRLEDEFHKANNFQTTMHGLKVRGVYQSSEQASARAKALNKKDPYFNVYVADVGEWLPWDPEPEDVQSSEYQSEELNKLMSAYKENAAKKDAFFEEEKRQKLAAAAAAAKEAKNSISSVNAARAAAAAGAVFGESGKEQPAVEAAREIFDNSGPADLAIARRAEAAAASDDKISLA
jgi:hypothetical protein